MWNSHLSLADEAPEGADLSSSLNNTSTWAWDEADEIAFVLQEEQQQDQDSHMHRSPSLRKLLTPTRHGGRQQRHVPHGVYYPFALTAW